MRALPGRTSRSKLSDSAMVTREDAGREQRRRILRATGELVAKRGYHGVTVELIVKRAKVSFRTFYKHFASKEQCFTALLDGVFNSVERQVRDVLVAEERPWSAQVIVTLQTFVDLIASDPILARACIVEGPTAGPVNFERYERASMALVPLFRRGRQLNPKGDALPATIEETLAGSVLWSAYQRLIVGETERIEELLPEVIELVLRPYLGGDEARRLAHRGLAKAP
jgi:AcrR family transcriptional regulator